jgi:predicted ferric reductase
MLFILVFIFIFFHSFMYNKYSQLSWKEKKFDFAFGCTMCMIVFVYLIFYS